MGRLKEVSAVRLRDNVGTVLLDLYYGEYDEVLVTYKGIPMGRILPLTSKESKNERE